ncbi:putative nuclease HARBI1 [Colias croceus]|uniref:putative nuclease HARBI1 n=2 Tax=Colias crocea TaxID=72248 RepID=UPI001E2804E8|nr:putative nuclease HARBI1 [Colias croceus]XP_045495364.1 putative nuclease HARBI1 [Colias croceus]XP_045500951.1 putative nuclease HARBI1 [Colias croceus]XP_045509235.1 putative nuclease HARBI1 [Colias croceus]
MEIFSSDSDSDLELLAQLSDWDSSDSEQERAVSSKTFRRINFMASLTDAEFTFRFRMNKASVESVFNEIMPYIKVKSRRNNGIPPLHQLLLALRFYALGTMLNSVADFAGVSLSSACRIVADISAAIARLYNKYIFLHSRTTDKFYNIAQFPRVCGAIDCTHVHIQSPCSTIGEEYRNRKGYFSINVQAVCDADLKLMNVVARWPGSAHDATIFNQSVLKAQCEDGILGNRWLLGDSAYPNRPYLLTPLLNPATAQEINYNEAQIKTRNTIERTFGVWKRRFPVISLTMRLSLYNIQTVIIATAVLHNICRNYNIEEVPPEVEMPDDNETTVISENSDSIENDIRNRQGLISNYF